jgi:tetratricopeptide (TPR) repeat protein
MLQVALSMIVRNEAKTLRGCLESVREAVHEIVIADTGSTDGTPEIAREFGARVFEIPWQNDFAAARNRALEDIRSEWILSLDADERLDASGVSDIPRLISAPSAAYLVPIRNYLLSLDQRIWDRPAQPNDFRLPEARQYPAFVDHENVRLFRRSADIYFVGRVHESVGPRVQALGLALGRASFLIHHLGMTADQQTRANKNIFYRELGKQKVTEQPDDAQAHLELGLVELDNFGNLAEALACFEKACGLNPRFGVALFFAGVVQLRLERPEKALRYFEDAERCGHHTAAVAESTGDASYNLRDFAASARAYRKALERSTELIEVESKLGLALGRLGKTEDGVRLATEALQKRPGLGDLHDRLIQLLVWLDRTAEAAAAAENKLRCVSGTTAADFVRAASLWNQSGNLARAIAVLHVGIQVDPGNVLLEQALTDMRRRDEAGVNRLVTMLQKGTVGSFQD